MTTTTCDRCEDAEATRRLTLTDLDGRLLDMWDLCTACSDEDWASVKNRRED